MSIVADDVKRHGKHYTPPALASFLVRQAFGALETTEEPLRILDPACGDGELLLAAAAALTRAGRKKFELFGFDLDADAINIAGNRLRAAGHSASLTTTNFLELSDESLCNSFDIIVTNPPYVRTQAIGGAAAQELAAAFGLQGRVDLTHPFVTLAPTLLREGGVLGLLCSNRFLSTKSGSNVRRILMDQLAIVRLFDLGDTRLFSAAVLPAVVIAAKYASKTESRVPFVRAYRSDATTPDAVSDLFSALEAGAEATVIHDTHRIQIDAGTLESGQSHISPWKFSSTKDTLRFHRIEEATWCRFGDLAKIRVGIKTTADSVFIKAHWDGEDGQPVPEQELLRPLLTHDDLLAWRPPGTPQCRVLYPYDLSSEKRRVLDLTPFPRTREYFEYHQGRLQSRKYVIDGGREWFEIWVPQRPGLWGVPKIVFPDISEYPRFALDRSGAVINGDCYWISLKDLPDEDTAFLMMGVANSSLAVEYYDHACGNKLYAGRRRWITQYVNMIPLPDPRSRASREIISLSRKLCDLGESDEDLVDRLNLAVEAAFAERCRNVPATLF